MNYYDLLLARNLANKGDITTESLSVTANGTYSEQGKAYSPVNVNVPLGTKSITQNGTYDAEDDDLKGYSSVEVNVPNKYVYGFHINGNESDPDKMVTYLEDAIGMTPAHMDYTNDVFDYGSWSDIWFIKYLKPCILGQDGTVIKYLDKNDYSKDVDGNTVDIGGTLADANVMIEFPKIFYKIVPDVGDSTSASVYFSPFKLDDGYHDYAYINYQGIHKEHFYLAAYNSSTISNTLRSLSGQTTTKTKSLNGTTEISYAEANGNGWSIEHNGMITLVNLLLVLMGKSTNTQAVYGQGLVDSGTEAINNSFPTGIHNAKGLFYGTNSGTASTYTNAVKVFGIENWWGFIWNRYYGDMLVNGVTKTKYCYGKEDGSTTDSFNTTGEGYITTSTPTPTGTSGQYCIAAHWDSNGFSTYSTNSSTGSASKYYCDGLWFSNSGSHVAYRGGRSHNGALCGAFFRAASDAVSLAAWTLAARIAYI